MATLITLNKGNSLKAAMLAGALNSEILSSPYWKLSETSFMTEKEIPNQDFLKSLGFEFQEQPLSGQKLDSWLQLIPLEKYCPWSDEEQSYGKAYPKITNKTVVLLEVPVELLSKIASEILRLGNDRLGFAMKNDQTAIIRVVGPPYYTMLRACDREIKAFVEQSPRVWMEIGYSHPFVKSIQTDRWLFADREQNWTVTDEIRFQDVYDVCQFELPSMAETKKLEPLEEKMEVPLRLIRGGFPDPASFWVIPSFQEVDEFVRSNSDAFLKRFLFAVIFNETKSEFLYILKLRPSKEPEPVLEFPSAYRPYLKIENLYLPCNTRLNPPLKREAIVSMFAKDTTQLAFLEILTEEGEFRANFVPDYAFQPLTKWMDYVFDYYQEPIQAWMEQTEFYEM